MPGKGRKHHLACLAYVFRHRHGTWVDMANFLKVLFGELPWLPTALPLRANSSVSGLQPIRCRHSEGGAHHQLIENSQMLLDEAIGFYLPSSACSPCLAIGTWDADKNPGFVVSDLCTLAARYLASIGKGGAGDNPLGRDIGYSQGSTGESGDEDGDGLGPLPRLLAHGSSAAERLAVELEDEVRSLSLPDLPRPLDEDGFEDDLFEDTDTLGDLLGFLREAESEEDDVPMLPDSISTIPSVGTRDSQRGGQRVSTKMRVATLAWLYKFADSPGDLRLQFRHLRELSEDIGVLHLCGCGLCGYTPSGEKSLGCCQRDHLILGDPTTNRNHRTFHEMLDLVQPEDYLTTVGIVQRSRDGRGVF